MASRFAATNSRSVSSSAEAGERRILSRKSSRRNPRWRRAVKGETSTAEGAGGGGDGGRRSPGTSVDAPPPNVFGPGTCSRPPRRRVNWGFNTPALAEQRPMSNSPKPERTQRPPHQPTLDTLGSAGQPAEHTAQGQHAPALLPPTTPVVPPELAGLQGYEIIKELGRGGMGVVYLARNKLMDRPGSPQGDEQGARRPAEAVDRFLQEIRSAARLSHPNVAMATAPTNSAMCSCWRWSTSRATTWLRSCGHAGRCRYSTPATVSIRQRWRLQRGHELGLVHRDIKPGNILLSKQGKRQVVKVIDFGLAKAKSEVASDQELTGTNQMMGTPGYTAPEQLTDAKNADTRSDIYSLGCTLYCLLTGEPPFRGSSGYAVLSRSRPGRYGRCGMSVLKCTRSWRQ